MSDLKTFLEDQRVEMVWARGNEHYHREFVAYVDCLLAAKNKNDDDC
jgi:hypothetical protein